MLKPTLFAVAAFAVFAAPCFSQTLFDDFNGIALDPQRWSPYQTQMMTVGNSRLNFKMKAIPFDEQVAGAGAYDGFRDDFDFIVDFDSFDPRMTRGEAAFEFYVADLESGNDGAISVRIVADATTRTFVTEEYSTTATRVATMPTGASAGQFRVQRTGAGITVTVHPAGQSWQLLKVWNNVLTSMVQIEVDAWCGDSSVSNLGTLSVNCDKITYTGKRYPGGYAYGVGCGAHLQRNGIAYISNSSFGLQLFTHPMFGGNLPISLILGTNNTPISLSNFGAPGCFLNTDLLILAPAGTTNSGGESLIRLPVLNDPTLVGLNLNAQAALRTNANAFGFVTSNGVALKIVKL